MTISSSTRLNFQYGGIQLNCPNITFFDNIETILIYYDSSRPEVMTCKKPIQIISPISYTAVYSITFHSFFTMGIALNIRWKFMLLLEVKQYLCYINKIILIWRQLISLLSSLIESE